MINFKKIIKFLFVFFMLSSPFPCKANMLTPTSTTLATYEPFVQSMPTFYFNSYGSQLPSNISFEDAYYKFNGTQLDTSLTYEFKPLSQLSWQVTTNCYDQNGNLINPSNLGLGMGKSDTAYCTFLYDITTGEICNIGDTYETSISSVNGGIRSGTEQLINDVLTFLGSTEKKVWIYDENTAVLDQINYYNSLGSSTWCYGNFTTGGKNHTIYAFAPESNTEHIYAYYDSSKQTYRFYADDIGKSEIVFGNTNNYSNWKWVSGTFNAPNGRTYNNLLPGTGVGFLPFSNGKVGNSDPNGYLNKAVMVPPSDGYTVPNPSDFSISYDKYINNPYTKSVVNNPNYNPNNSASSNNFPYSYDYGNTPDLSNDVYFYDVDSNNFPMPNPTVDPTIGESIGDIDPTEIDTNVPIISGLINRFPFSIPWDIYNLLKGFEEEREIPYIDTYVTIPAVNYEWHIQYDLSDFDGIASLFRTLFLIAFILGLAYFSYDHFFGE